MELSVIIVSYNVRYFLEHCLRSVLKSSEKISCEIFVIDNDSTDGSISMVSTLFPQVTLIRNYANKGFSAACNQGLKAASGRYKLLLNPDTVVEEDTFRKCISFMDSHPDAGGLGVKMIDGRGRILPESKRSLPTPRTAFFKAFGLSFLFPKSGFFNRYYLGHIDYVTTTKADVLTGAFMFLRAEAVCKAGLLDEGFFMYGEDIDYSLRILNAGFSNYYFPETQIIHYKGESTKKQDLNVLINFYKAMRIFVRKHYSGSRSGPFLFLINIAIFLRAGISLLKRILKKVLLPVCDAIILYTSYLLIASFWESYRFGPGYMYPETFRQIILPAYTIIQILSITLARGYRLPAWLWDTVKGVLLGTLVILIVYALLPLNLRFSRAVIVLGCIISLIMITLFRLIISFIFPGTADNPLNKRRRTVIVSDNTGYEAVVKLMSATGSVRRIAGRVSIEKDDMKEEVLGNIGQLREVIRINRIREIIFTTRGMTASQIMDAMNLISDLKLVIRIASHGEEYLLGSRFVKTPEPQRLSKKGLFSAIIHRGK